MIKNITTLGNPILRKIAKPVLSSHILKAKIQTLITHLIDTMYVKDGVGIAAPQINKSLRVIVINTKDGPLPLINPEIISHSEKTDWQEEGCLSVPNTFGEVERFSEIAISAINKDNEAISFKAKGMFARVLQHEIDHLNGILFIDKLKK